MNSSQLSVYRGGAASSPVAAAADCLRLSCLQFFFGGVLALLAALLAGAPWERAGLERGLAALLFCGIGSNGTVIIGTPPDSQDVRKTPSRFTGRDAELISDAAERAAEAALCYIEKGPDEAMNRYNQK